MAEERSFEQEQGFVHGAALSLVAERTSRSTRDVDLTEKLEVYGRRVPVYLLLDMQSERITVHSEPSKKGYQTSDSVPFGEPLRIPEPFGFEMDTSGFGKPSPSVG